MRGYLTETSPMLAYLCMMSPRLLEMRRILKDTGSIYLYCDPTASHYLKLLMYAIFGVKNFRNEIIWDYGARATVRKSGFPKKHDILLFYTKTDKYMFYPLYKPYKDTEFKRYNKQDEKGRYALVKRKRTDGTVYYGKCYINQKGAPETDVWDIPTMASTSGERIGYPTQKPEELLEKIIKANSNEGDVVCDPFCGCGTAIAVAERFNRQWVGIDITPLAIDVIKNRLVGHKVIEDVNVTFGRVDILTDEYAIEVDHVYKFHEGIGQVLHYAYETGKKPGLAL